jgi:hypothetical protein
VDQQAPQSDLNDTSRPLAAPPRRRRPVLAWAIAVVAVTVALGTGGFGLYALGRADGAQQAAGTVARTPAPASANSAAPAATDTPSTSTATTAPTTSATTPVAGSTPGQIDPKAKFTEAYQQQQLTLRPASCNAVYIDLDEPRVGVEPTPADLYFTGSCNSGKAPTFTLQNDGGTASLAASPAVTPNDCAQAIRTGPINYQSSIPITEKLVLCVATSLNEAIKQGIPQRIAVVQVHSIGQDGTVDVIASAWNVPR